MHILQFQFHDAYVTFPQRYPRGKLLKKENDGTPWDSTKPDLPPSPYTQSGTEDKHTHVSN